VSDDGSSFFNGDPPDGDHFGPIYEYDLSTGSERVLVEQTEQASSVGFPDARVGIMAGTVSPDGDNILFYVNMVDQGAPRNMGLEIFSRSTGESRVIGRFAHVGALSWSRDGRYVVANGRQEVPGAHQLLRISVEDGSVISLAESPRPFRGVTLSPDGRHIAVTMGEQREEIWRMTFNSER